MRRKVEKGRTCVWRTLRSEHVVELRQRIIAIRIVGHSLHASVEGRDIHFVTSVMFVKGPRETSISFH